MNLKWIWKRLSIGGTTGAILALAVLAANCGTTQPWEAHPVKTRLPGGETAQFTVDSELTRRYLAADWNANAAGDDETGREIRALLKQFDALKLTQENLRALSRRTSPDFATAYFIRRALSRRQNRALQNQFTNFVRDLRDASGKPSLSKNERWNRRIGRNYVFLFAPGLLYQSKPETKSDMLPQRLLLQRMGYRAELLPVHQAGSVEDNARAIADAIRRHRNSKIVLVSASKGGPDVAQALGVELDEAESRHVQAWVNVGGAIGGSPLADEILASWEMPFARLYGWFLGADACELAVSLSVKTSRLRRLQQNIPDRIFVLNYVAVPFSGSVIDEVRGPYARLRALGPNDGIVLLTEQARSNDDQMILAIGSDHRFRDPEIDIKTVALARIVLERVEGGK